MGSRMTNEDRPLEGELRLHLDDSAAVAVDPIINPAPWPGPDEQDLADPMFNAIWDAIKLWDVGVPDVYHGYCAATGNHAKAILESIRALKRSEPSETVTGAETRLDAMFDAMFVNNRDPLLDYAVMKGEIRRLRAMVGARSA